MKQSALLVMEYASLKLDILLQYVKCVLVWIAINTAAISFSWYLKLYCSTNTTSNMADHGAVLTITLNHGPLINWIV